MALGDKLLERVTRTFSEPEIPEQESLDEYLDAIIPNIRQWSEDLVEDSFFLDKPWREIRDDTAFHQDLLHFFNEGGEYLMSLDGDVTNGMWRYLERANKFMIEHGGEAELFELAFLSKDFFILSKQGHNHGALDDRKYFFMIYEPRGGGLEWNDAVQLLLDTARNNNRLYFTIALIAILIITLILLLSTG